MQGIFNALTNGPVGKIALGFCLVRLARVVALGYPRHVTQRGNRRRQVLFGDEDVRAYVELFARWCKAYKVRV